METVLADRTRIPLLKLAWPILVENALRTSLMSVDTFMLSRFSQDAVAAMSLVNQFAFLMQLLYTMVSIGASILITQNLGAGKRRDAGLIGIGSLVLIMAFSFVLSGVVALAAGPVIGIYRLDPRVALYARQFLTLYGGLSFFMAFNTAQASILRAWGHPRVPMMVNIIALVLTVSGNALCLFGPFGFPVLGVLGVAASTVASQVVACGLYALIFRWKKDIELPFAEIRRVPRSVYKAVLAVGVPTAAESLTYNLSQIFILSMIAGMGTQALATYGILIAVLRYVFMPGISIGSAAQIKVGYYVGAGRQSEAERRVYRYFGAGFLISLVFVIIIKLLEYPIVGLFTQDRQIVALAATILFISLAHEPGRNFNTIINPALKGAGDVRFTVVFAVASIAIIATFGSWLAGVRLGLGLIGVWCAMCADEWTRGVIMTLRWRSGAWKRMRIIGPRDDVALAAEFSSIEQREGV
jgi:putative MATE family efflux protein